MMKISWRWLVVDILGLLTILYMPSDLLKAHQHLDALVDKAYGKKFANDAERVAYLFDLYAAAVKEK